MTRLRLLGAALLCFVVSALVVPPASSAQMSLTTAVGRSMGGLRVLVIDILFIRAEALVKAGREDDLAEAQQLYETILDLDPANDTAHAFLVDMHVNQMLPLGTTREARFGWWKEGWDLANRGLQLNPDSAQLHYVIAEMLLDVASSQVAYKKELLPLVEALIPDRRRRLLAHLVRSIRLRENLPTRGFTHLNQLAIYAPEIAADAAFEGDPELFRQAMAAGFELLDLHGARLAQIETEVVGLDGRSAGEIDRKRLLAAGLAAVGKIRTALEADLPGDARQVLEAYAEFAGQNRVLNALRRLVDGR